MTGSARRISQECVEGYLFAANPLRILIFRRTPSRGRIWVPISGKVDTGDRSFGAALRRELREETGLRSPRSLRPLNWTFRWKGTDGGTWRLHAFAVEVRSGWRPRLSREHEAWAWVSPAEALRRLHYPDNRQALRRLLARVGARAQAVGGAGSPSSR